uniref:Uncharacterized protein n=1 Tax=Arundo donax TaxID=35708 RepID=A0A0A9F0D3_ARUDO
MRWSMPCALKKEYSSAVAPVMAKLAPFLKSVLCACDGGGSCSPKCSARKSTTRRPLEQRPVALPKKVIP